MSTSASSLVPSEVALTTQEREALESAIANLGKYSDHPVLGGLVGKLEGARGAASADRLGKAITSCKLAKSEAEDEDEDDLTQEERETRAEALDLLTKSQRDLESELALRWGGGSAMSVRKHEAGVAAGDPELISPLAGLPVI